MRSQQYLMPVRFDRTRYAIQSAKRALFIAGLVVATIQFDISPVLHGAAAHLEETRDRAVLERMPASEFAGSLSGAGAGRASPADVPELKHRMGYLEFED
jgi:hypothetical protein